MARDIKDRVEFDALLTASGEFGRYQILMALAMFPFYTFVVFVYFTQLFLTEVSPNHWCWVPELENLTAMERRSLVAPPDDMTRFGYSKCRTYDVDWTNVLHTAQTPNNTWPTIPCQNGWEFNKSEIPYPTITSEMGWVCDKDSYPATAQSAFFVGSIVGSFFIGFIADRYGRLKATIISNMMGCIFGTLSVLSTNLYDFMAYRFFTGIAYDSCRNMAYLIVLEFIVPKHRSVISNVSFAIFYSLALVVLPWIVLASGHWKIAALVTSVPIGFSLFTPVFLPESPKWLLSKGRVDEAVSKAERVAKINKKTIPKDLIERFKASAAQCEEDKDINILEVLKRPFLRRAFLIIILQYTCVSVTFDALFRSIKQLDFDFFISFTLISFTEFPSTFIVGFIMDIFGRKSLMFVLLTICAIFSVMTTFFSGWPSLVCAFIMRFMLNMAFNISMQWIPEILPAAVRASGTSIVHICSFIVLIISPYIVYLEVYISWLPLVILACICIVGALTALFLPETANREMPQTFDDAEEMVRHLKIWDFSYCVRHRKEKSGIENPGIALNE
ncbi:carcinine transporter-like [Colias croceus]|uniref:carcinine transporter-like n=1 Tax=Colias crocea TaxID=72248 RepID=UPI001E27D632|nr:carcinine transporter-like [Colias croceus]